MEQEQKDKTVVAGGGTIHWHEAHPWWSGVITIVVAALCVAVVFVSVIWIMGD